MSDRPSNDRPFLALSGALLRSRVRRLPEDPRPDEHPSGCSSSDRPDGNGLSAPPLSFSRLDSPLGAGGDPVTPISPKLERAHRGFEAAVKAVQARFEHLSEETISYPPRGWHDATFARQIAVHVALKQLSLPGYHLAEALQRSRESLHRAIHAVEDRLEDGNFNETYRAIALDASARYQEAIGDE